MVKTKMKGNPIARIIKDNGYSTTEISWHTGINVEELDLCVAGLYELSSEQEAIVKAYIGF